MEINVKVDFGAKGNGYSNDTTAIRNAIIAAKNAKYGAVIKFPPGKYRITKTLFIDFDNLAIIGSSGAVILVNDQLNTIIPILAQKEESPYPNIIKNLTIKDISIEFENRGPANAGAIQLNNCVDFYIENVKIIGNGIGMGGSQTDGIACAYQETTGVLKGIVVDGLSKPGIYISDGHDIRIDSCVVRNGFSSINMPIAGFNVANAKNLTISNCQAYCNKLGPGILISRQDTFPSNKRPISTCENGKVNKIIDFCTDIQILGGSFHNNHDGILIGVNMTRKKIGVKNLQISNVNCSNNSNSGINISAGNHISITDSIATNNITGIFIADVAKRFGNDMCNYINVFNCRLYDNQHEGVYLRAANYVTIKNCQIYKTEVNKQSYAIQIQNRIGDNKKNTKVQIIDNDIFAKRGVIEDIYPALAETSILDGYFRMVISKRNISSPNNLIFAPKGSEILILNEGKKYIKSSGGNENSNWELIKDR